VKLQSTFVKAACGALLLATLSLGAARADDPPPSAAAIASAKTIIASSGMQKSFDLVVPQMLAQLETNVIRTRPEIKDKLHATLLQLQPEFLKTEDQITNAAAVSLAKRMSESDLKDTAAFFQSPAGKKYVEAQPQAFSDIVAALQGWQQKLSTDMMTRVRDEMKKQGIEL
jgi:uncharacterized protein